MAVTYSDYLSSLGKSSKTILLAMENDKLTIEFTAAAAIATGQPLKLDNTGKVVVWTKADPITSLIGYALMDAAIGAFVTAMVRGFMLIFGTTSAATNAGPVSAQAYDNAAVIGGWTGYNSYAAAAGGDAINGWLLDQTAAAGTLVRILLMD